MRKRKYLFFDGTLLQGGAERVISLLTAELAKDENVEVKIILWRGGSIAYSIAPSVEIIEIPEIIQSNNVIKRFLYLRNTMKREKGIVISFLAPFNMIAIIAHFFLPTPIIVADRNDPRRIPSSKGMRLLRNLLYRFADGIVLQTEKNKEYFKGNKRSKQIVISNPIKLGKYDALALHHEKKRKIVTVGRLITQKNHKLLIDAFSIIQTRFPEYSLWIYGEGPMRIELETYIMKKGLNEKVILAGNKDPIFEELLDAEIFVLSSEYEGMPNALIEAMCLGVPVISTKVSGATDLICNNNNGLLVDINDMEGMANAIEYLINNEEARIRFACNASTLSEKLTVSSIISQWKQFIDEIIEE